ncbi:MAG: peptidase [Alphaproteobacteria bacterium]|nr:peptidase [Alphaproteobacteria bacterium]
MRHRTFAALAAGLLLAAAPAAFGQPPRRGGGESGEARADARGRDGKAEDAAKKDQAQAPVEEQAKSSEHDIALGGRTIRYRATAGTLTIRDKDGKPTASVFYVAYTSPAGPGRRKPVTFFYNGGPGSASLWLHMGSFGPMRVQTANPEYIRPAPYAFAPNSDTLLDRTDLVFLDAVGTGYSRPLGDAKPADFYGVDQDVDAFAKAILRYATRYARWNDPKFIFGESYGTTRSAALANALQERGMALNGVVLLSSILNYGIRQPGFDQLYIGYLPSYAATAWYHHKAGEGAELEAWVEEARRFANGPYAAALAKGQEIGADEADQVARETSRFTGLSPDFLKRANLRVDLSRFQAELLRDRRQTIGRYDSRYTGTNPDAAGERPEYDPSDTAISGAFIATFHDYLSREIGYESDLDYRVSARDGGDFNWKWDHRAPGANQPQQSPAVTVDLAEAMRTNPYLKVLSLNGYYDMATPFFSTERDLKHMMLEPGQQHNLQFRYYRSGHMVYLNPDELHRMRLDLDNFYDETVSEAASPRPPAPASLSRARAGGTPPN